MNKRWLWALGLTGAGLSALLPSSHVAWPAALAWPAFGLACAGLGGLLATRATRLQLAAARAKLRVAEERYAAVLNFNSSIFEGKTSLIEMTLNHMNQGVAVIRPDGRFWLYNKRALELTGVSEEALPFPPTTRAVLAEQVRVGEFGPDGGLLPEDVRAFLLRGEGRMPKSYTRRRPDGAVLEIRSDPMPDGSIIQTYTDITELARAKEAAEAAARAKASFLATMSHEIRTPLNGVVGASALMAATPLTAEQQGYVETIAACGEALLVVINDVLDFSRFEQVGVTLNPGPCAPARLLRAASDVVRDVAQRKGLALSMEGLDALPAWVCVDAARLRQALINLLGNAVKFTDAGGVTLRAALVPAADAPWLRVTVLDTGVGVPADEQARIFEEFTQGGAPGARRIGGTGLGLSITRKIVEAMGGRLGVDSAPGRGSAFWFEIPIEIADAPDAAIATTFGNDRVLRVLVAEDVKTNQLVIGAMLRALGHRPVIVADGAQALERLGAEPFDLLVLDMLMPEIGGLEAARRARAQGFDAPIVALTANAFESDRTACLAAGMDAFIRKPFRQDELARAIASALARPSGRNIAARAVLSGEVHVHI